MLWKWLLAGLLLAVLSEMAFAVPYEADIWEMFRFTGGGCCPSGRADLGMNKTFSEVTYKACEAHANSKHDCETNVYFALWFNSTKVYESSKWACMGCSAQPFIYPLNDILVSNISYSAWLGSKSGGFQFFEARMTPVRLYGTLSRNSEPLNLGNVSDITNPAPGSNAFRIYTPSRNVIAWFGSEDDYSQLEDFGSFVRRPASSVDNQLTLYRLNAWVCPDTNNNSICDSAEPSARHCWDNGGDWYKGYCCGINFTEGYVGVHSFQQEYCFKGQCASFPINITLNAICGKTADNEWKWAPREEAGEIYELLGWPGASILSNGTEFFSCGTQVEGVTTEFGTFRTVTIGGQTHEYSCDETDVYECSGEKGPFSQVNGVEMGSINPSLADTYYCASDGDWTTDLDSKDSQSCGAAGLNWSGSLCCGESDDPHEYYNDPSPNAEGACWNSIFYKSGEFVDDEETIISYMGRFFGCRITDSRIKALRDYHTNEPLVVNSLDVCGMVLENAQPGGRPHARCQASGVWEMTDKLFGAVNKSIAWPELVNLTAPGISRSGCCRTDYCWNGTECQRVGSFYRIGDYGFVCEMNVDEIPPITIVQQP